MHANKLLRGRSKHKEQLPFKTFLNGDRVSMQPDLTARVRECVKLGSKFQYEYTNLLHFKLVGDSPNLSEKSNENRAL